MKFTLDTWIISDTHFGHKNIRKYCGRPNNHNSLMIKNWVTLVTPNETVFHLGDIAVWYDKEEAQWHTTASSLPGKKYMIRGNHDHKTKKEYAELGIQIVPEFIDTYQLDVSDNPIRVLFSHAPDFPKTKSWDLNVHGHTHNNPTYNRPPTHVNVSVEVMRYRPVRLREILSANRGMVLSNMLS